MIDYCHGLEMTIEQLRVEKKESMQDSKEIAYCINNLVEEEDGKLYLKEKETENWCREDLTNFFERAVNYNDIRNEEKAKPKEEIKQQ